VPQTCVMAPQRISGGDKLRLITEPYSSDSYGPR